MVPRQDSLATLAALYIQITSTPLTKDGVMPTALSASHFKPVTVHSTRTYANLSAEMCPNPGPCIHLVRLSHKLAPSPVHQTAASASSRRPCGSAVRVMLGPGLSASCSLWPAVDPEESYCPAAAVAVKSPDGQLCSTSDGNINSWWGYTGENLLSQLPEIIFSCRVTHWVLRVGSRVPWFKMFHKVGLGRQQLIILQ
jgi:hypothetical protein